jgi:hypothetical protein
LCCSRRAHADLCGAALATSTDRRTPHASCRHSPRRAFPSAWGRPC